MRTKLVRTRTAIPTRVAIARKPAVKNGRRSAAIYFFDRPYSTSQRSPMISTRPSWTSLALASLVLAPLAAAGAEKPASARAPSKAEASQDKTLSDRLEGLSFRNIGPFRGGRSIAVTGVRHQPNV